jgi:hypothetical protein
MLVSCIRKNLATLAEGIYPIRTSRPTPADSGMEKGSFCRQFLICFLGFVKWQNLVANRAID